MRHGSFFTGIGGFDLAAEDMGWETIFQVEKNPYCRQVLRKNFPKVKTIYENIIGQDFSAYRGGVNIISGGFPCTQTSVAAQIHDYRDGLKGVDSGLWYEYLRAAGEIRSNWIVVENVSGVKKWGHIIQKGLEDLGYAISSLAIKACDFGLPHKRRRIIYVANANGKRLALPRAARSSSIEWVERLTTHGGSWLDSAPGTPGIINGVPHRMDRVKALGNAISPEMALEIFQLIKVAESR